MSCCHYDEGYDEGYEAGQKEHVDASVLEAIARRYERGGHRERADVVREIAHEIVTWNLDALVADEQKRQTEIRSLYKQNRTLAA